MSASQYDFSIEQGSSFKLSIVYKDKNKQIIDITGWCGRLQWTTNSGQIQIFTTENLDLSSYQFTIDGPNGKITLAIPASTTNSFNFSTAKYDLELQSNDDLYNGGGKNIIRVLYGTIGFIKRYSHSNNILQC